MRIRRMICLSICIVALIASVFMRYSIKNDYNEIENREEFLVPYFPESITNLFSGLDKILLDSPVIIIGTATGNSEYVFRNFWQEVVVSDVIKGEEIVTKNTTIKVSGSGSIAYKYDKNIQNTEKAGRIGVNTSFLNYMQEGEKYLIFISRKVNVSDDEIYELNNQAITMQYINLTKNENQVYDIIDEVDGVCEVLYKEVKNTEFVTNSNLAMKKFENIKNKLIKKLNV